MGYFKDIHLLNFRNFDDSSFVFTDHCNIILGNNGSGKTNLLEAISLFEKGRGFRKDKIDNLINIGNKSIGFNIHTNFISEKNNLKINVHSNDKNLKRVNVNDNSDRESIVHLESLFSIIYFLPEMERLFVSSPSSRRNFLDRLIFTKNKKYNSIINNYKRAILDRQALLKNSSYDEVWMDQLEKNIVNYGLEIYLLRKNHIDEINIRLHKLSILKDFDNKILLKINDNFYNKLINPSQEYEIYLSELKKNRVNDLFSGGCGIGPHRSDIEGFKIDNQFNVSQFSTGQQKTVVLLIIIAQCKYLISKLKLKPVILLDEVCSHLDINNRELLLYLVEELRAQVFMTGTEEKYFSFLSTKGHYCNIT